MPFLDVSEVLLDPDFADSCICHRSTQAVGGNGVATNSETNIEFIAVVTSDRGDILDRMATGERVNGSITIHSQFRLSDSGGGSRAADEVTWNGSRYVVSNVNNYSRFGGGFIAATADLKPLAG